MLVEKNNARFLIRFWRSMHFGVVPFATPITLHYDMGIF